MNGTLTKIHITNQKLWDHACAGRNIDTWLVDVIEYGNWTEYIGLVNLPYRSFSFEKEEDAVLFALKWA